jgi:hypothetical protein
MHGRFHDTSLSTTKSDNETDAFPFANRMSFSQHIVRGCVD